MKTDKYIALAKKLNELAKKGVGGEAINAQTMLKNLMAKYNITLEEVEGEEITQHRFRFPKEYEELMSQIGYAVTGRPGSVYSCKPGYRNYMIEATASEFIEFEAKANFYLKAYQAELKTFYTAFLYANNLFPESSRAETPELSDEQLRQLKKALAMAQNMDKQRFHKQLSK